MTRKQFQKDQQRGFRRIGKPDTFPRKRSPFWLPAPGFYVLSIAIAIAVFFLIWAVFYERGDDTPLIVAGISSSLVLGSAVFLREIILRNARDRYLATERQLDYNLDGISVRRSKNDNDRRLGIKRNAFLIEQLKKKSDAAKVLGHLPDGHWEVFELCNEYLVLNEDQLRTVGVGSPRLGSLRKGKEIVGHLHKFHLLNWVEIETRNLTAYANNQIELSDKIEFTQRALIAIESALEFYPSEARLSDSKAALDEFISSIKISHWIEQAERSAFKEEYQQAISFYRDALFFLARENVHRAEKKSIADRVNFEMEKIRKIQDGRQSRVNLVRKK